MSTENTNQPGATATAPAKPSPAQQDSWAGPRAWREFEVNLADALAVLEDEHYLIVSDRDGPAFVQFACLGHGGMRAEALANTSLKGDRRLSDEQVRRMNEMGWLDPTVSVRDAKAAGHVDCGGSPNFHCDWLHPAPFHDIAAMAVTTLHHVLGVRSTTRLCYRAHHRSRGRILLPSLGINPEQVTPAPTEERAANLLWPRNHEDLQRAVLAAIRAKTDDPERNADKDGDIPIRGKTSLAFVRVDREAPTIAVHSAVLQDVAQSPALLDALNELNKTRRLVTFFAAESTVWAKAEIEGSPFEAAALTTALNVFLNHADEAGTMLRERFGGRRAIDPARASEPAAADGRVN